MRIVSLPCNVKGYVIHQNNELSCVQTDGVTTGPFSDIFLDKKDISEYDIRTKKFKEELVRNKLIIGNLFMPDFDLFSTAEHDILSKVAENPVFSQSIDWSCAWLGIEDDDPYDAWYVDSYGNVSYDFNLRGHSFVVAPAFISKTAELDKYIEKKFESNESKTAELDKYIEKKFESNESITDFLTILR